MNILCLLVPLVWALFPISDMVSQSLQTGYADIDGRKVYYEMKGQGPAIVLIHGFSLDSRMWDPQFDALASSHQVLRYDASGYGRSTVPDSSICGYDELAALLKFLGIRKATLVGMSMGGNEAIKLALEHPEMVEGLVTVATTLDGFTWRDPLRSQFRHILSVAKDSGLAKAREVWLNDVLLTPVTGIAPIKAKIRQIVSEWPGGQFKRGTFADFLPLQPPAIKRLHEIRVPTLVLDGEHDDPNMLAIADTIAMRVPGAKKVIIPGSGHLMNLEQPEEFARLVKDFLNHEAKR